MTAEERRAPALETSVVQVTQQKDLPAETTLQWPVCVNSATEQTIRVVSDGPAHFIGGDTESPRDEVTCPQVSQLKNQDQKRGHSPPKTLCSVSVPLTCTSIGGLVSSIGKSALGHPSFCKPKCWRKMIPRQVTLSFKGLCL